MVVILRRNEREMKAEVKLRCNLKLRGNSWELEREESLSLCSFHKSGFIN